MANVETETKHYRKGLGLKQQVKEPLKKDYKGLIVDFAREHGFTIVLSMHASEEYVLQALRAGAKRDELLKILENELLGTELTLAAKEGAGER